MWGPCRAPQSLSFTDERLKFRQAEKLSVYSFFYTKLYSRPLPRAGIRYKNTLCSKEGGGRGGAGGSFPRGALCEKTNKHTSPPKKKPTPKRPAS